MKKLFFVCILLGTVIFGGIVAYSVWRVQNKTAHEYFTSGKKYYDEGNFSDAAIEFRNAIAKDSSHRDSRYYLALAYLSEKNLTGAIKELQAILEINHDDVPANLKLGGIYLIGAPAARDFYVKAQETAQKILSKEPQNVAALIMLGNAYAGLKDFPASVESLDKAVALDPKNVSALISLGSTRTLQKNFPEAEKAFLKAHEVDPKDKSALISLANYYQIAGNPEKTENVFNIALAQYPADREIYSQVTDFYLRSGRFADVEKILRAAQAARASDPTPTLDLADVYQLQNRGEDARKLLLDTKAKFPTSIPVSIKVAANLMPDKRDAAKQEIDQILKAEPKNPAGQALLGEFQYNSGQFDAAEKTLKMEPALQSPFPQVHYLLGNLALKKGAIVEAEDHFQKARKVDRRFIPARVAILNGLLLKNNVGGARPEIQEILQLDPRNLPVRLIKARLDAADTKYSDAEAELAGLVRDFPENTDVHRQMGIYSASRGRTADAEKSFVRALELNPTSEQSFQDLAQFYLQTKQLDRAAQRLNSVPDAQKQGFHYELLGVLSEQSGKLQDSEAAYKKAIEKDPRRLSAEMHLFSQYVQSGRTDDAVKRLDSVAGKSPAKNAVYAMKGSIQHGRGDTKGAEESYRKALAIDPATDLAANNLAYLLAQERRELGEALELAKGVRKRQPEDPAIADTLGWIYCQMGVNLGLAKAQAEFAVSKEPENGEFQYHLGEIYKKNSQNVEAAAALRKAVNSPKDFKEKSLAAADLKEVEKLLLTAAKR